MMRNEVDWLFWRYRTEHEQTSWEHFLIKTWIWRKLIPAWCCNFLRTVARSFAEHDILRKWKVISLGCSVTQTEWLMIRCGSNMTQTQWLMKKCGSSMTQTEWLMIKPGSSETQTQWLMIRLGSSVTQTA